MQVSHQPANGTDLNGSLFPKRDLRELEFGSTITCSHTRGTLACRGAICRVSIAERGNRLGNGVDALGLAKMLAARQRYECKMCRYRRTLFQGSELHVFSWHIA